MNKKNETKSSGHKNICMNKEAGRKFELEQRLEAGIVLRGTEVKALREGRANIKDTFARFEGEELFITGLHISEYSHGNRLNHPPRRPRKLLLHRRELKRLQIKTQQRGYTIVPTRMYFKNGIAKVEIALGKGKKLHDRRHELKRRTQDREMERAMKR